MCSIGEDDFGDEGGAHFMPNGNGLESFSSVASLDGNLCKKCNLTEAVLKLSFKQPECKECFLLSVRHKFRATLGSSKILPKNSDILLVFDGSPKSYVLLDMVHYAQTQNAFKRLHCNPKLIYIDETFISDNNDEEHKMRMECLEDMRVNLLEKYSIIESFYISLASNGNPLSLEKFTWNAQLRRSEEEEERNFKETLHGISSITSKQDFISRRKYQKLFEISRTLNCRFIFIPSISSDLATHLLTNVALGRGASTGLEVSFLDDRETDVKLLRPMKDISQEEITHYIKLQNLQPANIQDFWKCFDSAPSIQNATREFVKNLQINFPSTVSTIFRTGDKISVKHQNCNNHHGNEIDEDIIDAKCSFCHCALDIRDSKTLLATEFSRIASERASSDLSNSRNLEESAELSLNGLKDDPLLSRLCHGCRNIYKEFPCKDVFIS